MTVGQRIRARREELGLTQTDLAIKMGYSGKSSVSEAEKCGDNITTTKVKKFADALGVSVKYLMGYEESQHIIDLYANLHSDIIESQNIDKEDKEELAVAVKKYKKYKNLPPEIQKTIDVLLEQSQSDS